MKTLYVFVEGENDEIFVKYFFEKIFESYDRVKFWKYAQKKKYDNINILTAIKQIEKWDYILFTDFDSRNSIGERKREIQKKFNNELDLEKVFIVVEEIESWFTAVLDFSKFDLKNLSYIKDTQEITKEYFNAQALGRYHPKTHFLIEIMKSFRLQQGLKRNHSLNYTYYKLLGDKV